MRKQKTVKKWICLDCGVELSSGQQLSKHVKNDHGYFNYTEYKLKHRLVKSKEELLGEGAVTCKLCGMVSHDLTFHISRVHNISVEEYKEKYGPSRSEKYLKDQSERIKGDKNPAYEHGGKFSPLSDKFIHADKIDKDKVIEKISQSCKTNGNHSSTLSYWLKLGYTEEEAREKLSERQTTFNLEKCIEKYGEQEGKKRWLDRQEKWMKSINKTFAKGFSGISQELFWKVAEQINDLTSIYFAQLGKDKKPDFSGRNNEYRVRLTNRLVLPDFYCTKSKKIIEFDGTYWHGEHVIRNTNQQREAERNQLLLEEGYKVLHIKEEEYRKDPEQTVIKCLEFLND